MRFFYINVFRFCITFLGHLYLWEHGKESQMKIGQLIKYEENFHKDSDKILVHQ